MWCHADGCLQQRVGPFVSASVHQEFLVVERLATIPKLPRGPRTEKQGELRVRRQIPNAGRGSWGPKVQPVAYSFPDPPAGWQDGPAAWAVYHAHAVLGRGPEGQNWLYRTVYGGSISILGFSVDFLEKAEDVLIEVYGGAEKASGDPRAIIAIRTVIARRFGQTYVVIDSEDALTVPVAALRLALAGVSRSQYQ